MTLLVIRHASSSAPRPQLPAQLNGHRVLCSDCASLSEVRQCLCQPQARSADWVLLDVGVADEAQWQAERGALQAALERLPAQYIELQAPSEPGLESRLRLQHGPAAVVIDQRSQQAGYPLSLAIVGRRLAQEG
ncbi:TPA: hypothetical protein ACKP7W_001940 [Stenotrophomonas maltophilia]|uniref:hypothetical protein n=1 Tax=Stenotrophomonas TaxID=40323 RepID=UPI001313B4EF|nr:hypothetical protein [Stenotrophomonas sp. PE591]MBS3728297.1 hypothetical protein [Stenotrophomonas sp. PE591]